MIHSTPPRDGAALGPSDRINLRCSECGRMRTPIINLLIPDKIIVVCDECWRRMLMRESAGGMYLQAAPAGEGDDR